MISPDPTGTWLLCALQGDTTVLLVDMRSWLQSLVEGLKVDKYVHAMLAVSASEFYVTYSEETQQTFNASEQVEWVLYRINMQDYMVKMQRPIDGMLPPALCPHGQRRESTSRACVFCAYGSYKDWTGNEACARCGDTETTLYIGAVDVSQCTCKKGYSGEQCVACAQGKYKNTVGTTQCQMCPDQESHVSEPRTRCPCDPGRFFQKHKCEKCLPNTYKNTSGTEYCTACGEHMQTLSTASSSEVDCRCRAGFGLAGLRCTACEPGKYSRGNDRNACLRCDAGKYADATAASTCLSCPSGFYTQQQEQSSCKVCLHPDTTNANNTACEPASLVADMHPRQELQAFVDFWREDLRLKPLAELEHSPGGLM